MATMATAGGNEDDPNLEQQDDPNLEQQDDLEEIDILQGLPWAYHPLRAFLLEKLTSNEFPADYKLMGPFDVWNKYCDDEVFEGMEYDDAFKRRLLTLRNQYKEGKTRADIDLKAFLIAKANHPPPESNHRDEPLSNGSEAQRLLEIDMKNEQHFRLKPEHLWESRDEYQYFHLTTFRDHIHQADQTRKYLDTLKLRAVEKQEKEQEKVRKKLEAEAASAKRRAEKERADKEKAEAKATKQAERERKAAEKQAERERKAAEKEAAKMAKQAERDQKAAARAENARQKAEAKRLKDEQKRATAAAKNG